MSQCHLYYAWFIKNVMLNKWQNKWMIIYTDSHMYKKECQFQWAENIDLDLKY